MLQKTPWITIALSLMSGSLMVLPADIQSRLYFDYYKVTAGVLPLESPWLPEKTSLITGHWMHADLPHLSWNLAAFLILGGLLEQRSRKLLIASLLTGTLAVDIALLSPLSQVQYYCGLSGLLNTVFGVLLFKLWQETRSSLIVGLAVANAGKIIVEITADQSLFTQVSWPPLTLTHMAGYLATPVVIWILARGEFKLTPIQVWTQTNHNAQLSYPAQPARLQTAPVQTAPVQTTENKDYL